MTLSWWTGGESLCFFVDIIGFNITKQTPVLKKNDYFKEHLKERFKKRRQQHEGVAARCCWPLISFLWR